MARPNATSLVSALTSSGIQYQWEGTNYRAKGARDANAEQIQVIVAWDDAEDFLRDVTGYTQWDGTSVILDRQLPLQCPLRSGLWCDSYDLVKWGCYETRTDMYDALNDNVFVGDWCIYQLNFTRPPYRVRSNDTLENSYDALEQNRFTSVQRRYSPRERRRSGFAFEYQAADLSWKTIPDEAAFIPDYQIEYVVTWHQIPLTAIPELAIRNQLLTVNNAEFKFDTERRPFPAGTLLFKGPQQAVEMYQGADGEWYEDLPYVFSYQPGGWNKYLRPDFVGGARDYGDIRRRGGANDPPYPTSDFQNLFIPSDAV